jgi:phage-related minor tail protein
MRGWLMALAVLAEPVGAQRQPEARQLEAVLPVPAAEAVARVQGAFADEGLAVTEATGSVVTASGTFRTLRLRYSANVIPVGTDSARVVLTAFATRAALGVMPEASAQVTSRSGGPGKDVWRRLERVRAALVPVVKP